MADGSPGLPVIIIGGQHGDVPLDINSGKIIADLVVDRPGHYVLDMSDTESNAAQDRFATDFAERLYRRKARETFPLHVFVDEADAFIPQRPMPGQARMLGAFEALIRRGGIRGIGMTVISQRPAVINKNVLTQIECLIALQITSPQDRAAVNDWVRGHGSEEQCKAIVDGLASLEVGQAWFWSPAWLNEFRKIQIRVRHTFNSSATPTMESAPVPIVRMADVDLDALRVSMADTIDRLKKEDPQYLRREVVRLELALAERKEEVRTVEVPVLSDEHIEMLRELASNMIDFGDRILGALGEVWCTTGEKRQAATAELGKTEYRVTFEDSVGREVPLEDVPPVEITNAPPQSLDARYQKLLDAISTLNVLGHDHPSRELVGFIAGLSHTSGSFGQNIATLCSSGYIHFPGKGFVGLTARGKELACRNPYIPTLNEFHRLWLSKLGGTEARMLRLLIDSRAPMSRERIGRELGLSHTSGSFGQYCATLRKLGLADQPGAGMLVAAPILFPKGLK